MAVTSIWKVEGWLGKVLSYATNPEKAEGAPAEADAPDALGSTLLYVANDDKTEWQLYVSGVNCLPKTALDEMNATKRQYGKTGGIVAFHGYQSFAPGEATPAQAHNIGVRLARELWGDRFEVVVATHLDKGHLHNHIVVNSVSFADGRRFHRDNACYAAMRDTSDRLCEQSGLSVIHDPKPGRAKHYGEWKAEREGRPTWRSIVKADVDEAVANAFTERQFWANLTALGYDVKRGKDISVRPPGKERFMRLARNFGDGYTHEGICRRILANARPRQALQPPRKMRAQAPPKAKPALPRGSIVALYRRYRYLFGLYGANGSSRRAHFLLREDMARFDRIANELGLMERADIDTAADLAAYKQEAQAHLATLNAKRRRARAEARRAGKPTSAAGNPHIASINEAMKQARKEVALCEGIEERSRALPERIERIERDMEGPQTGKEGAGRGRNGPSGRANREDGARG